MLDPKSNPFSRVGTVFTPTRLEPPINERLLEPGSTAGAGASCWRLKQVQYTRDLASQAEILFTQIDRARNIQP